jgi:hypothetical protein
MNSGLPLIRTMMESGTFLDFMIVRARCSNWSVVTATAGNPSFTSSVASWTLHDVQAPQLANPTIAASHSLATFFNRPSGGPFARGTS